VQLYLPPDTCFNKDFLKDVLCERKSLFRMDQVKAINVPMYDELSIKNLLPMMMEEPMFRTYVPDSFPKGRQLDRTYFFNIMNTLNPEYTQAIIKYAEE
jgi:hypothetical protein